MAKEITTKDGSKNGGNAMGEGEIIMDSIEVELRKTQEDYRRLSILYDNLQGVYETLRKQFINTLQCGTVPFEECEKRNGRK